ncbi:MAG: lipase family protein [Planctomycetota bacterium]
MDFDVLHDPKTKFSISKAICLAKVAHLAYKPNDEVVSTAEEWGFEATPFEKGETQGFIASNDSAIILTFRGTESNKIEDWITDLKASFVEGPVGKVHQGFNEALESVWEEIYSQISELVDDEIPLWITGHSLGGALATLATSRFIHEEIPVQGLYTFGQPRCGNKAFVKTLNRGQKNKYFRFVNQKDIVPRVPGKSLEYESAGICYYLDMQQKLHRKAGFWTEFLDILSGLASKKEINFTEEIKHLALDHKMQNYLAGLEKNKIEKKKKNS